MLRFITTIFFSSFPSTKYIDAFFFLDLEVLDSVISVFFKSVLKDRAHTHARVCASVCVKMVVVVSTAVDMITL